MYAENILDHYKHPHRRGELKDATHTAYDANPLCGDRITIYCQVQDGVLKDVTFKGEGCAISQASASMLMDEIVGKPVPEVLGTSNEQIYEMLGVPLTTARVKCALLSLVVLKKALNP